MRNTRQSTRRLASKARKRDDSGTVSDEPHDNSTDASGSSGPASAGPSIMASLASAERGVKKLLSQIESLVQQNANLRAQLIQARQLSADAPETERRLGRNERPSLRRRIQELEGIVEELRTARGKDKRTIEKLRAKEVGQDARDLADDEGGAANQETQETADLGQNATRLLRRVCDYMDMNTLAEGEECPVCMDEMEVDKCYSPPCRHPVCTTCFKQLGDGTSNPASSSTNSVQCPQCRKIWLREDCEVITHTAVQQWDLLLEVSQEWTSMDVGEIDVAQDKSDEDSFINDSSVAATHSPQAPEDPEDPADLDDQPSAAEDTGQVTYASLPSPLKRKKLAALAAQRRVRQRAC